MLCFLITLFSSRPRVQGGAKCVDHQFPASRPSVCPSRTAAPLRSHLHRFSPYGFITIPAQSPLPLIKTQGLSAFLKMALSSLMMQRFNSSEKRKGKKSNKEAVTRMPSIPHNKKTVCHSWVCATQISRKSGPDALRMLVRLQRHKYRPGQIRYTSHEMY